VATPQGRLTLLSREGCGLCEEFAAELQAFATRRPLPPLETLDVDSDPELRRRYGDRIPVLLWDGVPVAVTHFDAAEIERLFRPRQPV
jgi:thioredoxin reductase (NADPH)